LRALGCASGKASTEPSTAILSIVFCDTFSSWLANCLEAAVFTSASFKPPWLKYTRSIDGSWSPARPASTGIVSSLYGWLSSAGILTIFT
jgi:hypothetical protein